MKLTNQEIVDLMSRSFQLGQAYPDSQYDENIKMLEKLDDILDEVTNGGYTRFPQS